jgi:hypothetical protein
MQVLKILVQKLESILDANPNLPADLRQKIDDAIAKAGTVGLFDPATILEIIQIIEELVSAFVAWENGNTTAA